MQSLKTPVKNSVCCKFSSQATPDKLDIIHRALTESFSDDNYSSEGIWNFDLGCEAKKRTGGGMGLANLQ